MNQSRWLAGLGQLSQGGVSMGGFGAGGLPQLAADINSSLPISSVGSQPYQSHYPLNSLGNTTLTYLFDQPKQDAWKLGSGVVCRHNSTHNDDTLLAFGQVIR